jgi:hypothetical protein
MQDISESVRNAVQKKEAWGESSVWRTLELAAHAVPESTIDWEPEIGEDWARVLTTRADQPLAAYLCARVPIAFVVKDYADELESLFRTEGVEVVVVADSRKPLFCVDPMALASAFSFFDPRADYGIDWNCFCAQDLWWATV